MVQKGGWVKGNIYQGKSKYSKPRCLWKGKLSVSNAACYSLFRENGDLPLSEAPPVKVCQGLDRGHSPDRECPALAISRGDAVWRSRRQSGIPRKNRGKALRIFGTTIRCL